MSAPPLSTSRFLALCDAEKLAAEREGRAPDYGRITRGPSGHLYLPTQAPKEAATMTSKEPMPAAWGITDDLTADLWWFIENVTDDEPSRTDRFFALRERMRERPAPWAVANLIDAARAIVRARDYCAAHGQYNPADHAPEGDQCFDDWAADILETCLKAWEPPAALTDAQRLERARAALAGVNGNSEPDDMAAALDVLTSILCGEG